ncbi:O-methyltransferase [Rhodohalobacter sulfatireducens]|uniref:Class I SAM-dependent methyltransferase n=1 Tax=Rhodohalobacter sulfatireducens TaxID=2911366 RepID=A0ABS9KD80_9BACT|nr:class I SAM-dependent methyltransferase [Rhodohalobacter sulfatireducens]MCG2588772.1 class I SAM-dependent methyltransferase [Rhodohalobacter sulfatireducens]
MKLINREISEYTESFTSEESKTLKELVQVSERELEYTDMLSGPQVGMLLKMLVQISGAKRILEIGTFTGYSAIWMADALSEDGTLITLEMNERYRDISRQFFEQEEYKTKIKQKMGNALEVIPALSGFFDLIFLDADKISYPTYYEMLKPKLKIGGLFVVDNVLWGGEVLRPSDVKSRAIHKLNKMIRDDNDVDQVMIPVRDGITIVRKK